MAPDRADVEVATRAGGVSGNQDYALVTDTAVIVLDGASAWPRQLRTRDGGWYARSLAVALAPRVDETSRSIREHIGESIAELADRWDLDARSSPTSAVAIARWTSDHLEPYVLGDSTAVVYGSSGDPIVHSDDRITSVAVEERARYRGALARGGGYTSQVSDLLADLQRAQVSARNGADGYWIAGADPVAAFHGIDATYDRGLVGAVAVMTDGAAAGVERYGVTTWSELPDAVRASGAADFLARVHQVELTDPAGRRWPRSKLHDDKTIALARFRSASTPPPSGSAPRAPSGSRGAPAP